MYVEHFAISYLAKVVNSIKHLCVFVEYCTIFVVHVICICMLFMQIRIHESPTTNPAYNMEKSDWKTTELLEVYNSNIFICN